MRLTHQHPGPADRRLGAACGYQLNYYCGDSNLSKASCGPMPTMSSKRSNCSASSPTRRSATPTAFRSLSCGGTESCGPSRSTGTLCRQASSFGRETELACGSRRIPCRGRETARARDETRRECELDQRVEHTDQPVDFVERVVVHHADPHDAVGRAAARGRRPDGVSRSRRSGCRSDGRRRPRQSPRCRRPQHKTRPSAPVPSERPTPAR